MNVKLKLVMFAKICEANVSFCVVQLKSMQARVKIFITK